MIKSVKDTAPQKKKEVVNDAMQAQLAKDILDIQERVNLIDHKVDKTQNGVRDVVRQQHNFSSSVFSRHT